MEATTRQPEPGRENCEARQPQRPKKARPKSGDLVGSGRSRLAPHNLRRERGREKGKHPRERMSTQADSRKHSLGVTRPEGLSQTGGGLQTLTSDNPDAAKRGMQMHNLREDDLRPTDGASQAACGMTAVPSQAQQRFAQTGEQRKRRDERGHSGRREKTLHIEKCADGTSVRMVPPISPLSLTWTANPPPAPCCSNHLDATTRNRKKMTAPTPPAPPASAPCWPSHKMGLTTG